MSLEMQIGPVGALRVALVKLLPTIPTRCSDPQCRDSTWDHECGEGPDRPNEPLADEILLLFSRYLGGEPLEGGREV